MRTAARSRRPTRPVRRPAGWIAVASAVFAVLLVVSILGLIVPSL